MPSFLIMLQMTIKATIRDRLLHVMLAVAMLLFLLVPAFSLFSMRQVQELSITLSLSAISFILMVISILLGSSSIWRDIERRYTASLLGLPLSRKSYILGKFAGIALFLLIATLLLGTVTLITVSVSAAQYRSDIPVHWCNVVVAIAADYMKYVLLAAIAMLFSSVSTSFYLPFFATLAIYLSGSAAQEVYEFITGGYGKSLPVISKSVIKAVYYMLPNLSAFNFKVQAIYGLNIPLNGLLFTSGYFLVYTAIVLSISVWIFSRRELP